MTLENEVQAKIEWALAAPSQPRRPPLGPLADDYVGVRQLAAAPRPFVKTFERGLPLQRVFVEQSPSIPRRQPNGPRHPQPKNSTRARAQLRVATLRQTL